MQEIKMLKQNYLSDNLTMKNHHGKNHTTSSH